MIAFISIQRNVEGGAVVILFTKINYIGTGLLCVRRLPSLGITSD